MFQEAYRGRMARCFILNITNFTYVLWKIFKVFLDESTREKIHLYKASYPDEVKAMIHPSQFLKRYGGQMEEPDKAWPPAVSSKVFTYDEKQLMTEEQYLEALANNPELVPRPDLIQKFKGNRVKNLLPEKTFYFVDRIEKRNAFNEVVETTRHGNSPIKDVSLPKINNVIYLEEQKLPPREVECDADVNEDEESKANCINSFVFSQNENGRIKVADSKAMMASMPAIIEEPATHAIGDNKLAEEPSLPPADILSLEYVPNIEEPHQQYPPPITDTVRPNSGNTPTTENNQPSSVNAQSIPSRSATAQPSLISELPIIQKMSTSENKQESRKLNKRKACKCIIY